MHWNYFSNTSCQLCYRKDSNTMKDTSVNGVLQEIHFMKN